MTATFIHKPSLRVGDRVTIDADADHPQAGSEGRVVYLSLGKECWAAIDLGDEFIVEARTQEITKIV